MVEINPEVETQTIIDKHVKLREIEEMKQEIQEVLQLIKKTKLRIGKLQRHNKTKLSAEIEESSSSFESINSLDLQIKCIEFDNNISWESLENLTKSKYDSLTKNDLVFAKIVKSLFFPNIESILDILSSKVRITDWKKHIKNLKSIIKNQNGVSFGEYLFKENLRFSKEIYDSYNEICLFGKDFDEDHRRRITRNFFNEYGSDITKNIKKRYDLFPEEARVFIIYLACMSGFDKKVLEFDYSSMHEFFQNVWMKINHNQDEFREKQRITNDAQKQIVHSDFSRFKTGVTSGFDSYFVLLNQDKYEMWFSEQKCGRGYSICKNYKNINDPLHKSVFNLAQKRTDRKFQTLLQKLLQLVSLLWQELLQQLLQILPELLQQELLLKLSYLL